MIKSSSFRKPEELSAFFGRHIYLFSRYHIVLYGNCIPSYRALECRSFLFEACLYLINKFCEGEWLVSFQCMINGPRKKLISCFVNVHATPGIGVEALYFLRF